MVSPLKSSVVLLLFLRFRGGYISRINLWNFIKLNFQLVHDLLLIIYICVYLPTERTAMLCFFTIFMMSIILIELHHVLCVWGILKKICIALSLALIIQQGVMIPTLLESGLVNWECLSKLSQIWNELIKFTEGGLFA